MATRFAGTELSNYFSTPNFGEMSRVGMDAQTMERNAATKAEGLVHGTGINSMAAVASAGYQADAIKAQGAAQAQSSIASGIGSMASGIAGGFGARDICRAPAALVPLIPLEHLQVVAATALIFKLARAQ